MKVAIIGAGLSGLSCAIELEKHGIKPDIYEKKDYIGDEFDFTAVTFRMFETYPASPQRYLEKKYGLSIMPFDSIQDMTVKTRSKSLHVNGKLGHMYIRGKYPESLENQLASQLSSRILLKRLVMPSDLKGDYQYIVAANGSSVPQRLNMWVSNLKGYTRVASVAEKLPASSVKIWFNTLYSKRCFCMLAPSLFKTSRLMMVADNISRSELSHYWECFLHKEKFHSVITEIRDRPFDAGHPKSLTCGNIFFTGDAGGFLDSFMGFGITSAIESGIMAARNIAAGKDYVRQSAKIQKHKQKINRFRKLVSRFSDSDYDLLVSLLSLPGIKQLIYNNPLFRIHSASLLVEALAEYKRRT